MTTDTDREHEGHLAGASRPLMNPPERLLIGLILY